MHQVALVAAALPKQDQGRKALVEMDHGPFLERSAKWTYTEYSVPERSEKFAKTREKFGG